MTQTDRPRADLLAGLRHLGAALEALGPGAALEVAGDQLRLTLPLRAVLPAPAPEIEATAPAPEIEAPAPAPEIEAPAPAPEIEAPAEDPELARMQGLRARGLNTREIAAQIGTTWQKVAKRLAKAKEAEIAARSAPATAPAAAPNVNRAVHNSPPRCETPPAPKPPARPSALEARTATRLARLGNPPPFAPEVDLQLAEALARGAGLKGAAETLGLPAGQVVARWRCLLPEPSVDGQAALLRALRARAAT
jgi:hypothetical protein